MDAYFKSEGFDTIGFEESLWVRPAGGKYSEDIYVSAHVDDCLLSCKSLTVMAEFKAHMLERFIGTDEGEVTEYLGCELVRDRKARTGQLIQAGYAERVLRVFNMWECNPVATPLDPNVRLSKSDCPAGQEVLYLRALLKGFAYLQHGPTEVWEDNASCIKT